MKNTYSIDGLPLALRDTALTVASLNAGHAPDDVDFFRAKCDGQVTRLREELTSAAYPDDVIEDALYAQCALLDEAVLHCLKDSKRDEWEREPLQVRQFNSHDAGNELIARITRRVAQPQPVLPLLAIFHAVLTLGFKGRFALNGEDELAALMAALADHLDRGKKAGRRIDVRHDISADGNTLLVRQHETRRWRGLLSPLGCVICAALGTTMIYLALNHWLHTAIIELK
jgi:type VI secretion system protein ImpK